MARPRTPTNVLEARGAFKRNPQRYRDGEPEVREPLGNPPDSMDGPALNAWHEIVTSAPLGVLTAADRMAVEMAAHLMAEFRSDPTAINPAKIGRLQSLLGSFGMTPSDRAKLSIPKAKERANAFAALDK